MRILSFLSFLLLLFSCSQTEKNLLAGMERQSPLVTNDISNQQITAFGEDRNGHIWIGTFRGLNKFSVNEYHQYFCTDDSLDIPDNHIQDIFLDSKKRLWISTVEHSSGWRKQEWHSYLRVFQRGDSADDDEQYLSV